MAESGVSPSPSMYSTRSRDSQGEFEGVLGTTVNVPAPRTPRTLFPVGTRNEEQNSTSVDATASSTPCSPRYLTRNASNNQALVMEDVVEDENEVGEGDSVVEASELADLNDSAEQAENECLKVLIKLEDDTNNNILDVDSNQICFDLVDIDEDTKLPTQPTDWIPKPPDKTKKEPDFVDVDNPGNWGPYTFVAKFVTPKEEKGKKKSKETTKTKKKAEPAVYSHHQLPTGCRPVPADEQGIRQVNGWMFHYKDWEQHIQLDTALRPLDG